MAATPSTLDPAADAAHQPMSALHALVAMSRPTQIALILLIFANGALLALWHGAAAGDAIALMLPAVLLLIAASVAVHFANESADHDTDRLTQRTPFSGGSGALEASGLSPRVPLALSLAIAGGVATATVVAAATNALPPTAAVLLLLGLGGGLAYSLQPLAVERRGWGEPLNAVLGGLLLPLYGVAVLAASVSLQDLIAFVPFLFVTLASVMATAWPDREADAATGKATMQERLAPERLRQIALLAAVGFIVSSLVSSAIEAMPLALLGLLVVPALVMGLVRYTRRMSPLANVVAMVDLVSITFVSLVLGLATGGRPA